MLQLCTGIEQLKLRISGMPGQADEKNPKKLIVTTAMEIPPGKPSWYTPGWCFHPGTAAGYTAERTPLWNVLSFEQTFLSGDAEPATWQVLLVAGGS
jgi:hypothetical protein